MPALIDVKIGDEVILFDLDKIDNKLRRRMISLGFSQGSKLCIKQKGVCNGPCTLESKGRCISIRRKDASLIGVKLT